MSSTNVFNFRCSFFQLWNSFILRLLLRAILRIFQMPVCFVNPVVHHRLFVFLETDLKCVGIGWIIDCRKRPSTRVNSTNGFGLPSRRASSVRRVARYLKHELPVSSLLDLTSWFIGGNLDMDLDSSRNLSRTFFFVDVKLADIIAMPMSRAYESQVSLFCKNLTNCFCIWKLPSLKTRMSLSFLLIRSGRLVHGSVVLAPMYSWCNSSYCRRTNRPFLPSCIHLARRPCWF